MSTGPMSQAIDHVREMLLRDGDGATDGELLDRFVCGQQREALETLVHRYSAMVWSVCRRMLFTHQDAEDAFQATFLVLVRKASSIKPREMVGNWLYGVACQTARKARAAGARKNAREQQILAMPDPVAAASDVDRDLIRLLDEELARLPDKYRTVVVMCELEGRSLKESARHLGLPDGTVASRLARGRAMLAKRLARHGLSVAGGSVATLVAGQAASAAIPVPLLNAAIQAVSVAVAGQTTAAIAPKATILMEAVVKSMFLAKLVRLVVALLVFATCGSIAGVAYSRLGPAEDPGRALVQLPPPKVDDLATGPAKAPPVKAATPPVNPAPDRSKLKKAKRPAIGGFKDEDLKNLPDDVEVLVMRGPMGYGSDHVTDDGITYLGRYKKLRVLAAGGFELTDRSLETIGKLSTLEELSLDSNKITGNGVHHLAGLKNLRRLDLNFNPLVPDAYKHLAAISSLTSLSVYSTGAMNDRRLEFLARLDLQKLALPEYMTDVTDRGLEHIAKMKRLENLTLMRNSNITDAGLAKLETLTQLKNLTLDELQSVTPAGFKVLAHFPELRGLHVNLVRMDGASMKRVAGLTKLEDLLLWSVALDEPRSLEHLGELSSLRYFRTNQRMPSTAIRALARLPQLESISDDLYEISDEDLTYLARLPKLESIVLASDKVTAASLPTLTKMKSLRRLSVTEKVRITPEQLTELGRNSLPNCTIARYRPPYTVFYEPKK